MFNSLSERITQVVRKISGQHRLSEDNIKDALREVRLALLEADVALPVIKDFLAAVQSQAVGQEILVNLNAGQVFIKLVHDELIKIMGETNSTLQLNTQPPAVILMAGLQGSGKTTSVGKLARWLKETQHKKVMVVSCDIYRPAAIEQLAILAQHISVSCHPSRPEQAPVDIAMQALQAARQQVMDVLIVDTAGRLHIDAAMMAEIKQLHQALNPIETLFVVDSMTGQDAAKTAKVFNEALPLTGIVLTKTDGDARGGAALSIRHITGKPIKFIGVGEKIDALQAFHPERIASRILGMGDIVTLVEEAQQKVDQREAERLTKKLQKGRFDLEDFRDQIIQMNKMGGMANLLDKLPGGASQLAGNKLNDKMFVVICAVVDSMTAKERRYPHLIQGSRKRRIAKGSGTTIQAVSKVLKQFEQMRKMMDKMRSKGGMLKMMRHLKGSGMLPPL